MAAGVRPAGAAGAGDLPDAAGRSIFSLTHDAHSLAPWAGFGLFLGYTAAAITVAAVLLARRDT